MDPDRRDVVERTEDNVEVAGSTIWESSSTPVNASGIRGDVTRCDVRNLSAQSIDLTRSENLGEAWTHQGNKYQRSNSNDNPPSYADTICDYRHLPHHAYKLQHVNNAQTREDREEEVLASVNRKKYKERVKFCKRFAIFTGFIYAMAAVYLMQWHQKLAARWLLNQEEALRSVVSVSNPNNSEPYEGRLVHVVGALSINEPLTDPDCGFAVTAVKLKRFVHDSEIYMMVKKKRDYPNTTETPSRYYYTRKGGDVLLRSNQLCVNPITPNLKRWDVKNQIQMADNVRIGNFTIGDELKTMFNEFVYVTDKLMELPNDHAVRLIFSYAGRVNDVYSVIGRVVDGVIVAYRTSQGDDLLSKRMDLVGAEEMIRSEQFNVDFEFYRRSYVLSLIAILLGIALIYYCKIHPLISHGETIT